LIPFEIRDFGVIAQTKDFRLGMTDEACILKYGLKSVFFF
jgi:hypothetical protein